MQITLPDHPKLYSHAVAAGFSTVEDYVRHLVEKAAGPLEQPEPKSRGLSHDEWARQLEELLAIVEPGNPHVDDSRESIYSVR